MQTGSPGTPQQPGPPYPPQGQPVAPQAPPAAYPPQGYGDGQSGPAAFAHDVARHIRTPETKEFFKTSEFAVWLVTVAALLIAGLAAGNFFSHQVWPLVTGISAAYILSRGLSKAGAKRGSNNDGSS